MLRNILVLSFLFVLPLPASAQWDFSEHSISPSEILSGGPPRDGIPALFDPEFIAPEQASSMDEAEMVLGVTLNGIAKAYPLRILSWHELVNEHYGDKPVLVSW